MSDEFVFFIYEHDADLRTERLCQLIGISSSALAAAFIGYSDSQVWQNGIALPFQSGHTPTWMAQAGVSLAIAVLPVGCFAFLAFRVHRYLTEWSARYPSPCFIAYQETARKLFALAAVLAALSIPCTIALGILWAMTEEPLMAPSQSGHASITLKHELLANGLDLQAALWYARSAVLWLASLCTLYVVNTRPTPFAAQVMKPEAEKQSTMAVGETSVGSV